MKVTKEHKTAFIDFENGWKATTESDGTLYVEDKDEELVYRGGFENLDEAIEILQDIKDNKEKYL